MALTKALACCCISEDGHCCNSSLEQESCADRNSSQWTATISTTFEKVPDALFLIPFAVVGWVKHHIHLMRTGDSPHLKVEFSWIVAASSLLYLLVAMAFFFETCYFTTLLFSSITVTSLFSDSISPSSRTWCCLDRSIATLGAVFGPIRAIMLHATSLIQSAQIASLSIFSLLFLAWSRRSTCQNEFILRHSCWHLVSSVSLVWLARNVSFH